jgi:hypothetical protein
MVTILLLGSIGYWLVNAEDGPGAATPRSPGASGTPDGPDGGDECPNPQRPLVDLNVQAVTGIEPQLVMSRREVADLVGLAADAGAQVISTAASFRTLHPEPGKPFRYSTIDLVVDEAQRQGLGVRLDLLGMPGWALDNDGGDRQPPRSEAELAHWLDFVRALMVHLKGRVDYVEVWNKANLSDFWSTGPNPVEFVRLIDATNQAIKRVDPDVQVVTGGLAGNDIGFLEAMYEAVDRLGLDGLPADLLGIHPFADTSPPQERDPGRIFDRDPFGTVDQNFRGFEALHEVMVDNGDEDLGIYITQFGYSTAKLRQIDANPDGLRASYLPRALDLAACAGYVTGLSWYNLHPTPWDPAPWALVDRAGRPTETYEALRDWSANP